MKKIYATYAEQRAARNARQNAKRAQLVASGLTSKGVVRKRGAGIHSIGRSHLVQAPSVPCQSIEDFIAHGGRVEVLPGLRYTLPRQLPVATPATEAR